MPESLVFMRYAKSAAPVCLAWVDVFWPNFLNVSLLLAFVLCIVRRLVNEILSTRIELDAFCPIG